MRHGRGYQIRSVAAGVESKRSGRRILERFGRLTLIYLLMELTPMDHNELFATLRTTTLFRDLPDSQLEPLTAFSRVQGFATSEIIFFEKYPADHVYMIIEGSAELVISTDGGGSRHLAKLDEGDLLGWSPLVRRKHLTATARATSPSKLVVIDGDKLLILCESNPRFGYDLMHRTALVLSERLSATRRQLITLASDQLPEAVLEGES
jgi:CRP/FNR family cyclic AMP-dependent transcriptional regulator